jgi:hypothetical protein
VVTLFIVLLLLFVVVPVVFGAVVLIGFVWIAARVLLALVRLLASIRVERR